MKKLLLILAFVVPVMAFGQEIRWEQIKPISAQVEKLVPVSDDLILIEDNAGNIQYIRVDSLGSAIGGAGGAVSSVFGRTGAVIAVADDYEGSEITNTPSGGIEAITAQAALNELDAEKADTLHASRHEDGGNDEISVAGLSGVLADNQPFDNTNIAYKNQANTFTQDQNISGDLDLTGELNSDENLVYALGDRSGSLSLSSNLGYKATLTLTGNFELFYENIKDGGVGSIEVYQNVTGGYSFTLSGATGYTTEVIMSIYSEVNQTASSHTTVNYWRSGSILYYEFIYNLGEGGGGSGAPVDATYITQTTNGTLTAEQALSALSTGFMKSATSTGIITTQAQISLTADVSGLLPSANINSTLTGKSVNGVTLTAGGSASNYLNQAGGYTTPAGGGNVSTTGTPVNNQVSIFTDPTTIEGDADLTFNGTTLTSTNIATGALAAVDGSLKMTFNSGAAGSIIFEDQFVNYLSSSAPSTPVDGMRYQNTTDNKTYERINNAWVDLGQSGGASEWTVSGSEIYRNSEVWVGSAADLGAYNFQVTGLSYFTDDIEIASTSPNVYFNNNTGVDSYIGFVNGADFGVKFFGATEYAMILKLNGTEYQMELPYYGVGDVTGTPAFPLAVTSDGSVIETLAQPLLNGAKTASFTHDASAASIGAYTVSSVAAITISIHNLSSGMMGTLILDIAVSPVITINTYSDAGSTGLTEVILGNALANVASKATSITYTCANNGTTTQVYLGFVQEQ